jgi:hypothetical protein
VARVRAAVFRTWRSGFGRTQQDLGDRAVEAATRISSVTREGQPLSNADRELLDSLLPIIGGAIDPDRIRKRISRWETRQKNSWFSDRDAARAFGELMGLADHNQFYPDAFADLMWAAGMPRTPPRPYVWHNFTDSGKPAWIWIRVPGAEQRVTIRWVMKFTPVNVDRRGAIVTAPVSVSTLPLTATFANEGWADFGHGVIPPEVTSALQIPVIPLTSLAPTAFDLAPRRPAWSDGPIERWIYQRFVRALELVEPPPITGAAQPIPWSVVIPAMLYWRDEPMTVGIAESRIIATGAHGELETQLLKSSTDLMLLREARGMSEHALLTRMARPHIDHDAGISAPTLRRLMGSHDATLGRRAALLRRPLALAKLDWALDADGTVGVEVLGDFPAKGPGSPRHCIVPAFWHGPVWFQVLSDEQDRIHLSIKVAMWKREVTLDSGDVCSTRKNPDDTLADYTVVAPRGTRLIYGVGAVPGAIDINHGWRGIHHRMIFDLMQATLDGFPARWQPRRPSAILGGTDLAGA